MYRIHNPIIKIFFVLIFELSIQCIPKFRESYAVHDFILDLLEKNNPNNYYISNDDNSNNYIYGIPDLTFNNTGYKTLNINNSDDQGRSLVLQSDGKILLGGYCKNGSGFFDSCIARFNSDGSIDNSFNSTGYTTFDIGANSSNDIINSIIVDINGKILIGGACPSPTRFCLARFDQNGVIDSSFNGSGYHILDLLGSSSDVGNQIILDSNSKILMVGNCYFSSNIFCIARFNNDGTFDNTFGSPNGYITYDITGTSTKEYAYTIGLQSNGKIVIGGACADSSNYNRFCVARFETYGNIDTTFDSTGYTILDIPGSDNEIGFSLRILNDDKILLGGTCQGKFCVARFNANGGVDTSFGTSGYMVFPLSTLDNGRSMKVRSDGKIVIGGFCQMGGSNQHCLLQLDNNGNIDTTFGTSNGFTIFDIPISTDDRTYSLEIQPDGKTILGGYCSVGTNQFCLSRYQ